MVVVDRSSRVGREAFVAWTVAFIGIRVFVKKQENRFWNGKTKRGCHGPFPDFWRFECALGDVGKILLLANPLEVRSKNALDPVHVPGHALFVSSSRQNEFVGS